MVVSYDSIYYSGRRDWFVDYFQKTSITLDGVDVPIVVNNDVRFSVNATSIESLRGRFILRDEYGYVYDFVPEELAFKAR